MRINGGGRLTPWGLLVMVLLFVLATTVVLSGHPVVGVVMVGGLAWAFTIGLQRPLDTERDDL